MTKFWSIHQGISEHYVTTFTAGPIAVKHTSCYTCIHKKKNKSEDCTRPNDDICGTDVLAIYNLPLFLCGFPCFSVYQQCERSEVSSWSELWSDRPVIRTNRIGSLIIQLMYPLACSSTNTGMLSSCIHIHQFASKLISI